MADDGNDGSDQIIVGQVLGVKGNFGEIRVKVLSDVPDRFAVGQTLAIDGNFYPIYASTPVSRQMVTVRLRGIDNVGAARQLSGQWVTVSEQSAPQLPDGEYFHFQLLGLRVITDSGEELGTIAEIIQTGSNDVYVVSGGEGGDILIPALGHVVVNVNLADGIMTVHLMEGLR